MRTIFTIFALLPVAVLLSGCPEYYMNPETGMMEKVEANPNPEPGGYVKGSADPDADAPRGRLEEYGPGNLPPDSDTLPELVQDEDAKKKIAAAAKSKALDKEYKAVVARIEKLQAAEEAYFAKLDKEIAASDLAKKKIADAAKKKALEKEGEALLKDLKNMDKEVADRAKKIKEVEGLVRELAKLNKETAADLAKNSGWSTGNATDAVDVVIVPDPPFAKTQSIIVGSNDKVGSGAKLKQKVQKTASGLLGGLLGIGSGSSSFNRGGVGGGSTFGRSGGGASRFGKSARSPDNIKTEDDPVPKDKKQIFTDPATGTKIAVGIKMTPDGMLVSTDILEAPGDGTFQAIYLEDPQGRKAGPTRYDIYDMYNNWKLTVSWTRDYFENGQRVKHEEGGWSEDGRDFLGTFKVPMKNDGVWNQLGFSNAVQGVKGLGAFFPIKPEALKKTPLKLVVHVTQPNKDPVTTVPFDVCINRGKGIDPGNPTEPMKVDIRDATGPDTRASVFDGHSSTVPLAKRAKGVLINPPNSQGKPDLSCLM